MHVSSYLGNAPYQQTNKMMTNMYPMSKMVHMLYKDNVWEQYIHHKIEVCRLIVSQCRFHHKCHNQAFFHLRPLAFIKKSISKCCTMVSKIKSILIKTIFNMIVILPVEYHFVYTWFVYTCYRVCPIQFHASTFPHIKLKSIVEPSITSSARGRNHGLHNLDFHVNKFKAWVKSEIAPKSWQND